MEAPVIGVCSAYERAEWSVWDMDAAIVPSTYLAHLSRSGAVPLALIPSEHTIQYASTLVRMIDGLLLLGGADVDPSTYNKKRAPKLEQTVLIRDHTEIALVRAAMAHHVPILGVCRGMQIMTVATGGSLTQDIGDLSIRHRPALGLLDEGTKHPIVIEANSWIGQLYGEAIEVNSHHHQAIRSLGKAARITATCPHDGVVEAVEWALPALTVGVQWHPEASKFNGIISEFVKACITNRFLQRTAIGQT